MHCNVMLRLWRSFGNGSSECTSVVLHVCRPFCCRTPGQSSVAVVGSGPSGIYFVDRLRRLVDSSTSIDLFERLPTPFGLVRFGVAPDHPDTKNVTKKFNEVCSGPGVRFFGNVHVGQDITVAELARKYTAVVLAYGAEDDRRLGLEDEDERYRGSLSAREFVNWYNGHPMFCDVNLRDLQHVTDVGIIGLGNVALDCARILLRPVTELQETDIADHALAHLRSSKVQNVHIIGRRGPMQAQFSGKELREVLSLANVSVHVHPQNYKPTEADAEESRKAHKVRASSMPE
jgi:NADPH-dependent glutamate synthase beta subunit-like oxidoreductase